MSHVTGYSGAHITDAFNVGSVPSLPKLNTNRLKELRKAADGVRNRARMMESRVVKQGPVTFPEFTGERLYMMPFRVHNDGSIDLPVANMRWMPTIKAMLAGIFTSSNDLYLMVDQAEVKAGQPHRRGGVHIDGNWVDAAKEDKLFNPDELLLLASDVFGCKAYTGIYDLRQVGSGGDCTNVKLENAKEVRMEPGYVYAGTVATLHESVPVAQDCKRTLVRINAARCAIKPPETVTEEPIRRLKL